MTSDTHLDGRRASTTSDAAGARRHVETPTPAPSGGRDWARGYLVRAVAVDALCGLVAGVAALLLPGTVPLHPSIPAPYVAIVVGSPFVWVLMVWLSHGYERRLVGVGADEYRALSMAGVRLLAITAFISYATYSERPYLSRYFVLVYFPVLVACSLVGRVVLRWALHRARLRGRGLSRAVVVGQTSSVENLVRELRRDPVHGIGPVAACTSGPLDASCDLEAAGGLRDVLPSVERCAADVVVVVSPSGMSDPELRRLAWDLDDLGIELMVAPGIVDVTGPRLAIRPAANLSLLHVERPALRGVSAVSKAVIDRVGAAALLVLLSPVFVVVGLLVRLDSKGPVFFRQRRIGLDGRSFSIIKFRSMVTDAPERLHQVRAQRDDGNGVMFKRRRDPRVTRVGRVLRRFSLDELPQLVNVLRGQMSLVGPRPPLPEEVENYGVEAARKLRVRPGMTGLWQVSGRSNLTWDETLRLDLRYVDNWSIALDTVILLRTVHAVARGRGAY